MDMLKRNLQIVRQGSQKLHDALMLPDVGKGSLVLECADNSLYRLKTEEGMAYLNSVYDEVREFRTLLHEIDDKTELLVLFGFGNGRILQELHNQLPNLQHLVVVDVHVGPFLHFLSKHDFGDVFGIFPKVSFLFNEPLETLAEQLDSLLLQVDVGERVGAVVSPIAYQTFYQDYYVECQRAMLSVMRFRRVNWTTREAFRQLWLAVFWKNLSCTCPDIGEFSAAFSGRPAIIVSAGPSLNKQIDQLRELKDRALIIAVGSAISILQSHNIVPHLRIAVDATQENEPLFNKVKTEDCPLIFGDHLYFPIVANYKGPKIRLVTNSDQMGLYLYKQANWKYLQIRSGFSVANVAFDMALKMGCDPVVLVGQDLCYTGGKLHAAGAWDDEMDDAYVRNELKVVNILGEEVFTDTAFLGMKKSFEWFAKEYENKKMINATEGGLEIRGLEHRTLAEVVDEYMQDTAPFAEMIREKYEELLVQNRNIKERQMKREVEKNHNALEKIRNINRRIFELGKALHSDLDKKDDCILTDIERKTKKIEQLHAQLFQYPLFKEVIYTQFAERFGNKRLSLKRSMENLKAVIQQEMLIYISNAQELEAYMSLLKRLMEDYLGVKPFNIMFEEQTE